MLRLLQFNDLDHLAQQPYDPPPALVTALETASARSEPWWALQILPEGAEDPSWLVVFPEREGDLYFLDGEILQGRWDEGQQVFLPEEGLPLDLQGRRVSRERLGEERVAADVGPRPARSSWRFIAPQAPRR